MSKRISDYTTGKPDVVETLRTAFEKGGDLIGLLTHKEEDAPFSEKKMTYRDFTVKNLREKFYLELEEDDIFSTVNPADIRSGFKDIFIEDVSMALSIGTEKAASEFIVAPLLAELRRMLNCQISLFSGTDFTVNEKAGLTGMCDFILCGNNKQMFLNAPIIMVVDVQHESVKRGIVSCIAQMYAASVFNTQEKKVIPTVYGAVTTGSAWRFLKFSLTPNSESENKRKHAIIDSKEYFINDVEKLLRIFLEICLEK